MSTTTERVPEMKTIIPHLNGDLIRTEMQQALSIADSSDALRHFLNIAGVDAKGLVMEVGKIIGPTGGEFENINDKKITMSTDGRTIQLEAIAQSQQRIIVSPKRR